MFALAAGIAGLGGALYAMQQQLGHGRPVQLRRRAAALPASRSSAASAAWAPACSPASATWCRPAVLVALAAVDPEHRGHAARPGRHRTGRNPDGIAADCAAAGRRSSATRSAGWCCWSALVAAWLLRLGHLINGWVFLAIAVVLALVVRQVSARPHGRAGRPGRVVGAAAAVATGGRGGAGPWRRCEVSGVTVSLRRQAGARRRLPRRRARPDHRPDRTQRSGQEHPVRRRLRAAPAVVRSGLPGRARCHPARSGPPVPARAGPHVPAARTVRPAQRAGQPARRGRTRPAAPARAQRGHVHRGPTRPGEVADRPADALPTGVGRLVEVGRALAVQPKAAACSTNRRPGRTATRPIGSPALLRGRGRTRGPPWSWSSTTWAWS